jgi:putative transposase
MSQVHNIQNNVSMLVTSITARRHPYFSNPSYAREAVEHLYRIQQSIPFFLHAFVIMPDHCHFLLRVPSPGRISDMIRLYKMGLSFHIGISPLWQPRFHIRIPHDSAEALQYIHMNPVRKNLVETSEE